MPNTPKLPEYAKERIYLQQNENIEEITWCADMVGDDDIEYVRADVVAQELSTLKAQVRKEIEELRHTSIKGDTSFHDFCYSEALTDCLSIPSLKGKQQ